MDYHKVLGQAEQTYEILSNDQEQSKIKNTITEALKELDDRSKQIIEARWLN